MQMEVHPTLASTPLRILIFWVEICESIRIKTQTSK